MEDRVKITADDSDYQNVMRRAGDTADKFKGRIDRASHGFESLFKKTPHRRTELAISGLVSSLASGDLAGAVTGFTARMTGLGLGIGVAVGAGLEIFEKFHESIKATTADTEALEKELKKPVSLIAGLSPQGIDEQASKVKAVYDKMIADHSTFINKLAREPKSLLALLGPIGMAFSLDRGKGEIGQTREEQDALNRLHTLQKEAGKSVLERAQGLRTNAGDSQQSALTELYFKSREAEAAINMEGGKGRDDKIKALKIDEERLTDEIVHRNEVRQRENDFTERQLKFEERLQRAGVSISDEKKKQLKLVNELDQINAALADPATTADEKVGLRLNKHQTENELRATAPRSRNPFPFGTTASRAFESQFGFSGFTRRGIEDSLGFGGLARGSIERGESLTPEEALLKTGTSANDIAAFKKNVGDLPGTDSKSQDVVGAVQHLETELLKAWQ